MKNSFQSDELLEIVEKEGFTGLNGDEHKLEFKDLMRHRIDKILLVCSLYDYYTIVEDGHLQEALFNEYLELNLYYAPQISRTYSGNTALEMLDNDRYDLVITTLRLGEIELSDFADTVKEKHPELPVVLLASQSKELQVHLESGKLDSFDRVFIWSGERRIFLAIIKLFEDKKNAPGDCLENGITNIILVEDSPNFYSAYLPLIYTEVMKQTQKLIEESKNSPEKLLKQRARPKIFLATNYEEAYSYFEMYKDTLLGLISDLKFKKDGIIRDDAGFRLIAHVKEEMPNLPVLLQSNFTEIESKALRHGIYFLDKSSRTLLLKLRNFMQENFGFGDFVFRMPDGSVVQRARNLRELRDRLKFIPNESLLFHSRYNHFSYWLIARTQFELAYKIRPVKINSFETAAELRKHLIHVMTQHIHEEQRGVISIFQRSEFDNEKVFQMIGEGSLGGKARGLGFIDKILKHYIKPGFFPGISISIPNTIVLGADVFSHFMELNDLYEIAVKNIPDEQILRAFLRAELPPTVLGDIREIIHQTKFPLAVRSSSLLEDAVYQPFAGIYATVMLPNSNTNAQVRFQNLVQAIKYVYASTYFRSAKNYIEATGNRIEEEKMAVIIQRLVGKKYGNYFYPHISGVAKSYNYYPFGKSQPKDGVVNLALGLGKTIVDGGVSMQFSPRYPGITPQFGSTSDLFNKSQIKYWALDMTSDIIKKIPDENSHLKQIDLGFAERHGTLKHLASTYSPENDIFYEGIARKGPRVLNFAPILKSKVFPLNDILKLLMKMSEIAMNAPVEIEFAVNLAGDDPTPAEFKFLQVRPMVKTEGKIELDIDKISTGSILLKSDNVLGNGVYFLDYMLYVNKDKFNPSRTRQIAAEIDKINRLMLDKKQNYLLLGPGRWGSSDPWLGIPVDFSNISAAQAIVETAMPHMTVDPSQGSHFFHNITSFRIAYFTMNKVSDDKNIDWDWINNQPAETETGFLRLVRLKETLEIRVDGHTGRGIIIKGE